MGECCSQSCQEQTKKKSVNEADAGIPLPLPLVTKLTSLMMGGILLYCGYTSCQAGTFECSWNDLPDISHVMGKPPLNKLYAIMLTFYAFVKQAYVRSYHHRLSAFDNVSKKNTYLLCYAAISCVFGPLIGFWDVYYDMQVHCIIVAFFVIGEVGYILTIVSMIKNNRTAFPQSTQSTIDWLILCRAAFFTMGVISLGAKYLHYELGVWGAILEWSIFNLTFVIFALLSDVMPYDLKVVRAD